MLRLGCLSFESCLTSTYKSSLWSYQVYDFSFLASFIVSQNQPETQIKGITTTVCQWHRLLQCKRSHTSNPPNTWSFWINSSLLISLSNSTTFEELSQCYDIISYIEFRGLNIELEPRHRFRSVKLRQGSSRTYHDGVILQHYSCVK